MAESAHPAFDWDDEWLWPQFDRLVDTDPGALALVDCRDRQWSRGELRALACTIADDLKAAGISAHQRVLVIGHKEPVTIAAALAVSLLEGIFCPVSPKLGACDHALLESLLGHAAKVTTSDSGDPVVVPATGDVSTDAKDAAAVLIGFT